MIKDKLKQLRDYNALTQEQVAEVLGIRRPTYAYYELGRAQPSLETIGKLAILYKISLDEFLDNKENAALLQSPPDPDLLPPIEQGLLDDRLLRLSGLSYDEQLLVLKYRCSEDKNRFWREAVKILDSEK
ncbi:MAG: helix-turn-helix transcriptional regulator [Clostridiales bacterium]|nr:helix-turn-helix transcriptional regulator [Clostridiales bacterium]